MIDNKKPTLKNLYEALDNKGQPFCLLAIEQIWQQNLFHKTVALLLEDRQGRMLLRARLDGVYDFSFFAPVPAFMGSGEFAVQAAFENWKVEKILPLCKYSPRPENSNSFSTIFSLRASNALAEMFAQNRQKFLLVDSVELASLIKFDLGVSPFLKLFLEEKEGSSDTKKNTL